MQNIYSECPFLCIDALCRPQKSSLGIIFRTVGIGWGHGGQYLEVRKGQPPHPNPHQLLAELNLSFKGLELIFAPQDLQSFHWHCIILQRKSRRVFRKKNKKRQKSHQRGQQKGQKMQQNQSRKNKCRNKLFLHKFTCRHYI